MCGAGRGTPQCSKWPLSRASDRKISPMKKEIAMQTTGSWTNLRATATGATVLDNWRSHLGNLGEFHLGNTGKGVPLIYERHFRSFRTRIIIVHEPGGWVK